ncbi:EamA family transporter [Actinospica robiniae]|uniref:EamA family transporter n=1 Tax=Actinospica robiniae TaxID=304901 RepID=UPI000557F3B5|nr:EamA family transporter [Actinospica robiniae]
MPLRDRLLAGYIVLCWALSFPVTEGALSALPPFLVGGLRFSCVAVCCLFVPRPPLAWRWIVLIGLFSSTGQYALLYLGMAHGMPSGLTALVLNAQAPMTILVAAVVLRERPTRRRIVGVLISCLGLLLVGLTRGQAVPWSALLIVLGAGASWSIGNVCTRMAPFTRARPDNGFRLVVWSALIPPLPLLALSLTQNVPGHGRGLHAEIAAMAAASPRAWLALAYMVVLGTILGMSAWSSLLAKHPADRVTPYALGIPVVALIASRMLIGESLTAATIGACALVLAGIALVALPAHTPKAVPATPARETMDEPAAEPATEPVA